MILLYSFAIFACKPEIIEHLDCRVAASFLAGFKGYLRRRRGLIILDRLFRCGFSLAIDAPLEKMRGMAISVARNVGSTEVTVEIPCS